MCRRNRHISDSRLAMALGLNTAEQYVELASEMMGADEMAWDILML